VLVKLTYVTELSVDSGAVRFTIPTTVSPRYAPAIDRTGVGRPDAETLNPPVDWRVPYGLDLSVRIMTPGRITAVESPSHPISVSMTDDRATVSLTREQAPLDRDFVLSIATDGLEAPQALIERDDSGRQTVAVSFVPAFAQSASPAEIIFMVDRSGSMEGDSIEEVRNALQLCLRSMIAGCRFNIVGFGSAHEALFPATRAYDQSSLDAASAHVVDLAANLGGTEILPALEFVLEQPRHAELRRQVVVLTDGQVTNTDAVLALARAHADARIFTFGIGAGASHHLVRGLARAGGGCAEFIHPGERVESKVVRQFGRLLSPALDDVRIDWVGAEVTRVPVQVPPIFAGSRLLVYGCVDSGWPTGVRLSATGPAGPVSFEVPLEGVREAAGKTVATLAARTRIRELEESGEWLTTRGSRQTGRKESRVSREIVELSVRYGLISRETSLVAVERRETPVVGEVKLRRVPIALTSGWGGVERAAGPLLHAAMASRRRFVASMADTAHMAVLADRSAPSAMPPESDAPMRLDAGLSKASAVFSRPPGPPRREPITRSAVYALIALQQADGSWELTADLAAILGRERAQIGAAIVGATGSRSEVECAWATALALAWLELHAAPAVDEWRLLAEKARHWLDAVGAAPPRRSSWPAAARRFLVT
jgi:Ca-activated chloride channel family protein